MKANELMIGDWIYDNYHQAKAKVNTLTRALLWAAVEEKDGFYDDKQLRYVDVQPIPLTAEILERNGIELIRDTFYFSDKGRPVHIRFADDYIVLSINADHIPMNLRYVHELQHALRLCKIDKEIGL